MTVRDRDGRFAGAHGDAPNTFARLGDAPAAFARLVDGSPQRLRDLRLAEIGSSLRLADRRFTRGEVAVLTERGIAPGGRPLADCNALADYAAALELVARLPPAAPDHPWLRLREIAELHALATRRSLGARPGLWRVETLAPRRDGSVAPAPWAIPREIARYAERIGHGPPPAPEALPLWLAGALRGFDRIAPFSSANGRAGRLVLAVLLRRLRLPPLIVEGAGAARELRRLLDQAGRGDSLPLARFLAGTLLRTIDGAPPEDEAPALVPLASLAPSGERAALYKAVERGRMRAVRRGERVLSTQAWLDDYRRTRSPAGRPSKTPPR